MATTNGFFDNMARRATEIGQQGLDYAKQKIAGLRGTATPEAAPAAPAPTPEAAPAAQPQGGMRAQAYPDAPAGDAVADANARIRARNVMPPPPPTRCAGRLRDRADPAA